MRRRDSYEAIPQSSPEDIQTRIEKLKKTKSLNKGQKKDLDSLCSALEEKLANLPEDSHKKAKVLTDVEDCVRETENVIQAYAECQRSFDATKRFEIDLSEKADLKAKLLSIDTEQKKFIKNVKDYEKKCAKWNLGQKIFIGACTFVGGLVGAVLGAAAGLAAGAAIGGGVGSVVPLFGNIAGAVIAGNVGAIVGIIKGIGLGAAIGTAAATAIMAGSLGYGAKKGAGSSLFMTKQQKFVTGLKSGMQEEIKLDSKDYKKYFELKSQCDKLKAEKSKLEEKYRDRIHLPPKERGLFERNPNKIIAAKENEIKKVEEKMKELVQERKIRKNAGRK